MFVFGKKTKTNIFTQIFYIIFCLYIGFLSRMRDWTVAVVHSTVNLLAKVNSIFENIAV